MLPLFQWWSTWLILSRTVTLSGHNPLITGSKAILLQCLTPCECPKWPLFHSTPSSVTISKLQNDIKTGTVQYWSWMLKKGWIGLKPMSSIYATRIRMHLSIKVWKHGPACIAFHCSQLLSLTLGVFSILPKHGCLFKQPLLSAKVLNILIYCYYLLVKWSSMHELSKFEIKLPPS